VLNAKQPERESRRRCGRGRAQKGGRHLATNMGRAAARDILLGGKSRADDSGTILKKQAGYAS